MGVFSWNTSDTNESIPAERNLAKHPTNTVFMRDNQNRIWKEEAYEGYGVFGGKDYYELMAEMNGKVTRDEGITLEYQDDQEGILRPTLSAADNIPWENMNAPTSCEFQGYFYYEDEEEW